MRSNRVGDEIPRPLCEEKDDKYASLESRFTQEYRKMYASNDQFPLTSF